MKWPRTEKPDGSPPGDVPDASPPRGGPATLSAGEAISYALGASRTNAGPLIVAALAVGAAQGAVQIAVDATDNVYGRLVVVLSAIVVSWALSLGLVQAALAVLDGRRPEVSMLFSSPRLGGYLLGALLAGTAMTAGLRFWIIPGFVVLFLLQFWGYALVDGQASDPLAAMKESVRVVRASFGSVVFLDLLLFLAWFAVFVAVSLLTATLPSLSFLALVVTAPVVYPVAAVALAYAWRQLTGGAVTPVG